MTIPFETLRRKWMKDPKFRAEYKRIGPEMELAFALADARRADKAQRELTPWEQNHDPGTEPA